MNKTLQTLQEHNCNEVLNLNMGQAVTNTAFTLAHSHGMAQFGTAQLESVHGVNGCRPNQACLVRGTR